jgi:uncharacterized protein (DUF433 family)
MLRLEALVGAFLAVLRPKASLVVENLVLRQQLALLRRRMRPRRICDLALRGEFAAIRMTTAGSVEYLFAEMQTMDEEGLLQRITVNPEIFGGKPIVRGRRLAVEHVLGMLAAGDTPEVILEGYPWLEPEDIRACLVNARRLVGHERVEPLILKTGT